MDIQFNTKTSIGAIIMLIFIIILSQSRIFDFLIDTHLGRIILIALIIGISYTHKFLGVLVVLFIILMFNFNRDGFSEGFDTTNQGVATVSSGYIPVKNTSANSTKGREGSNMVEREGMILKGKSSIEIPVTKQSRNQGDNIEPSDAKVLKEGFFSSV